MGGPRVNWFKLIIEKAMKENIKLLNIVDKNIRRDDIVKFVCGCGKNGEKGLRCIIKGNSFYCKECIRIIRYSKAKITNMEKFGCENPSQSKIVREKLKKTNLERYGTEYPIQNELIKEKIKKTNLERYGCENPYQNEKIKEKIKQINIKKYGVEHPMQNKEIYRKNKRAQYASNKTYKFKTGEEVKIQGYEPFALKILESQKYTFYDIKIEYFSIMYKLYGKNKGHIPDIFIPKENRIIEVKSTWTYEKDIEKNLQKQLYSMAQGYIYEFWIFDNKGNLEIK